MEPSKWKMETQMEFSFGIFHLFIVSPSGLPSLCKTCTGNGIYGRAFQFNTHHPCTCDVNEEHLWQYIKKNKKWKWRRIQISSEYILNPGRHRYIVVVSCGSTSSKRGGGGGVELVKGKSYPINVLEQGRRKELFLCGCGRQMELAIEEKNETTIVCVPLLFVFRPISFLFLMAHVF